MKLFSEVRTCGVPEFYTESVKNMMKTTGINSFDDLIRISGLSYGTGAWFGNGECAINEYSKREMRYLMEVCQEMYEAGFDFVSDKINSGKIDGFSIENCKLRLKTKFCSLK